MVLLWVLIVLVLLLVVVVVGFGVISFFQVVCSFFILYFGLFFGCCSISVMFCESCWCRYWFSMFIVRELRNF